MVTLTSRYNQVGEICKTDKLEGRYSCGQVSLLYVVTASPISPIALLGVNAKTM